MKIGILIPVYNLETIIQRVIKETLNFVENIIVVDDGSTDNTKEIVKKMKIVLLEHKKNMGKGMALKTGFEYLIQHQYDGVITMDGDGQHEPKDIPRFIEKARVSNVDVIIGSRMQDTKNMPFIRYINNWITSHFISLLIKQKIEDSQCGFRFIKTEVLKKIKLVTKNYDLETEFLIKASRSKYKIVHLPVKTIYGQETSHFHFLIDSYRIIKLLLTNII